MPARPSCIVLVVSERRSWRRVFGSWYSDSMNLTMVAAKMNNPDDFLVRASTSPLWGHGLGRSRSLLCAAIVVNLCVKYNWISLSTLDNSTPWSKKTWVMGSRRGRRKPVRIRGSGLPVMKNFTSDSCVMNWPRTERTAEDGSLSIHSSNASMTMTHLIFALESGPTTSFSSWVMREVWAMVGSCLMIGMIWVWKGG